MALGCLRISFDGCRCLLPARRYLYDRTRTGYSFRPGKTVFIVPLPSSVTSTTICYADMAGQA